MYTIEDLVNIKVLPKTALKKSFNENEILPASEYEKLDATERKNYVPVLNNAIWVTKANRYYYSYNEEQGVGKSKMGDSKIMLNEIKNNKLVPSGVYNLNRNDSTIKEAQNAYKNAKESGVLDKLLFKGKGDKKMENNTKGMPDFNEFDKMYGGGLNTNFDDLGTDDALKNAGEQIGNAINEEAKKTDKLDMEGQDGAGKKATKKEDELGQIELSDADKDWVESINEVRKFIGMKNIMDGDCGILCYITRKPAYISAKAPREGTKSNKGIGKDKAGQSDSTQQDSISGNIGRRKLVLKLEKPGPIVGAVVKTKRGCIINPGVMQHLSIEEVEKKFQGDKVQKNSEVLTLAVNLEVLKRLIVDSFYYSIPELKETFGGRASNVSIDILAPTVAQKKKNPDAPYREILKSDSRRTQLVIDGCYFPLKEYETIDLAKKDNSLEDIRKGNFSLFQNIFKATPKDNTEQVNMLTPEYATVLKKDGDVIKSTWFPEKGVRAIDLKTINKFDKEMGDLTELRVPIKDEVLTKKGDKTTIKTRTVNCLSPSGDPEKENLDSLHNGRYDKLIDLADGALTYDSLAKTFKTTKAKNKNQHRVGADNAKLIFALKQNQERTNDDLQTAFNNLMF